MSDSTPEDHLKIPLPLPPTSRRLNSYVVVFAGMLLQNFLLFGLSIVNASYFGAQADMDAFRTSFTPPMTLAAIFALSLGPVVTTLLARNETTHTAGTVSMLFCLAVASTVLLAIAGTFFPEPILRILHPWFDQARQETSLELFRIMVWILPLNTMIGLSQAILYSRLNFVVPAVSGIVGPVVTIVLTVSWAPDWGVHGVAWATVIGAIASVLTQSFHVWQQLVLPRLQHVELALAQFRLGWPLLLGTAFLKLDPIIDQMLGSGLPAGAISHWDYATRMMVPFLMLSSGTLSTVTFPHIAKVAVVGGEQLRIEATFAFRVLVALLIPAFVVMVLFAEPLIRDLLQRHSFTAEDTRAVATLFQICGLSVIGMSISEISSKMMYGMKQTLIPNLIVVACLTVGFFLKFAVVGRWGITGIAVISGLTLLSMGVWQLLVVARRVGLKLDATMWQQIVRSMIGTALAAAIGAAFLATGLPFSAILGLVCGGVIYFGFLVLMSPEFRSIITRVRARA